MTFGDCTGGAVRVNWLWGRVHGAALGYTLSLRGRRQKNFWMRSATMPKTPVVAVDPVKVRELPGDESLKYLMLAAAEAVPALRAFSEVSVANSDGQEFAGFSLAERRWHTREPDDTAMPALPLVYVSFKDGDRSAFTVAVSFGGDVRVN
jgi:hypothetical protein